MNKWINKIAIVTGSTLGIGASIAKKLLDNGIIVVGLDIRENKVALCNKKCSFHSLLVDVSKEEEVVGAYSWIKQNLGPIHILINNAAIKKSCTLIDGDTKAFKECFDINVLGLCTMTREGLKDMIENNVDGHIIHINSIAGHLIPNFSDVNVYAASKHAVTALAGTLRQDLSNIGSKIKVTSISPALVKTPAICPEVLRDFELIKNQPFLNPEDVAEAVLYTLSTPPHVQVDEIILQAV